MIDLQDRGAHGSREARLHVLPEVEIPALPRVVEEILQALVVHRLPFDAQVRGEGIRVLGRIVAPVAEHRRLRANVGATGPGAAGGAATRVAIPPVDIDPLFLAHMVRQLPREAAVGRRLAAE